MHDERLFYYQMGVSDYPESVTNAYLIYDEPKDARQTIAEEAYIKAHNRLPEWAVLIEDFEEIDGAYIFVHRDPDMLN